MLYIKIIKAAVRFYKCILYICPFLVTNKNQMHLFEQMCKSTRETFNNLRFIER